MLQGNKQPPLKIAVLGARGIGKVHARIFHSFGAEIVGILGSTAESASAAAEDLFNSFGCKPKAFSKLEPLLNEPVDAVCVCSPPRLHFDQIVSIFNKGLPVFCEKPLFWNDGQSLQEVETMLEQLRSHPLRRFYMNAPNALFLDAVKDRLPGSKTISTLKFSFYTNGNYKGIGIGIDLFTHGLSILIRIFGIHDTTDFKWEASDSHYNCHFIYAGCQVEFDFKQDPKGIKLFMVDLDGHSFTRIQEGIGSTYHLYFLDSATGEKIKVEDPFNQSIQGFMAYCRAGAPIANDGFGEAAAIMKLMAKHLVTT